MEMTKEMIDRKHQEDLQRLRGFRLMDDDFLTKCFSGKTDSIELVLKIILGKNDLKVEDVQTQVFVENILNRSVRLDVLATDSKNVKYNIEIQRADAGAGSRRARYNSSMIDANLLEKSQDFNALPETYVIFITEHDVMKEGRAVYRIERCDTETGKLFNDGAHIVYVNGAYRDESAIGKLMHDFSCTDSKDMYYDVLAERVKFYKESKEGVAIMCRAMEELRAESIKEGKALGKEEGIELVATNMIVAGKENSEIKELTGFSEERINELRWRVGQK